VQAFMLCCEFMYTGNVDVLEDAEVAINVWMVASALQIRGMPDYIIEKLPEVVVVARLHLIPGLVRQSISAWDLSRSLGAEAQEQGDQILHFVMEFILCQMQARGHRLHVPDCTRICAATA
jgi:hypothetical protein